MWTCESYWCPTCQQSFEAFGLTDALAICRCGDVGQRLAPGTVATFQQHRSDILLLRAQLRVRLLPQ